MSVRPDFIFDRPLTAGNELRLSRADDISGLVELIEVEPPIVFLWSPPKSGMTTFTVELLEKREHLREKLDLFPVQLDLNRLEGDFFAWAKEQSEQPKAVLLKEVDHDTADGRYADQVKEFISQNPSITVLVPGRLSLFSELASYDPPRFVHMPFPDRPGMPNEFVKFRNAEENREAVCIAEFSLSRFRNNKIASDLIEKGLRKNSFSIDSGVIESICDSFAGNLYLIQAYVSELLAKPDATAKRSPIRPADANEDTLGSSTIVSAYFKSLATAARSAIRNRYYLAHYILRKEMRARTVIHGLNFIHESSTGFASGLIAQMFAGYFAPLSVIDEYLTEEDWLSAVSLCRVCLEGGDDLASGNRAEFVEAGIRAAVMAQDSGAFHKFGKWKLRLLDGQPSEQRDWLCEALPKITLEMLQGRKRKEGDFDGNETHASEVSLDIFAAAIEIISGTGEGRIYMLDSSEQRLVCREAWGQYANEWRRTPVETGDRKWKIVAALQNAKAAGVDYLPVRTTTEVECHDIATRRELDSCWIFSLGTYDNCIGVLCVDNPGRKDEEPSVEAIRSVIRLGFAELQKTHAHFNRTELGSILRDLHENINANETRSDYEQANAQYYCETLSEMVRTLEASIGFLAVHLAVGADDAMYRTVFVGDGLAKGAPKPLFHSRGIRFKNETDFLLFNGRPTLLDDVFAPEDARDLLKNANIQHQPVSLLRIPFRRAVRLPSQALSDLPDVVGYCDVFGNSPLTFDQELIETIVALVTYLTSLLQANEAVHRQGLYDSGIEVLNQRLAQILNGTATREEFVDRVTYDLAKLFGADLACYLEVDEASGRSHFVSAYSSNDGKWPFPPSGFLEKDEGITGKAVSQKRPKLWHSALATEELENVSLWPDAKTVMSVPIKSTRENGQQVIAAFCIESSKDFAYSDGGLQIVQAIASQIPFALSAATVPSSSKNTSAGTAWIIQGERLEAQIDDERALLAEIRHKFSPAYRWVTNRVGVANRQASKSVFESFDVPKEFEEIFDFWYTAENLLVIAGEELDQIENCLRAVERNDLEEINLREMVDRLIKSEWSEQNGEISQVCGFENDVSKHHVVYSSAQHVQLVLQNLIRNAFEASPSDARDVLFRSAERVEDAYRFVDLTIANNGTIMPENVIKNYHSGRPCASRKQRLNGSIAGGMGLWIVKRVGHRIGAIPVPGREMRNGELVNSWRVPFPRRLKETR